MDQYSLKYKANEVGNIPDRLLKIRDAIANGTFNEIISKLTAISGFFFGGNLTYKWTELQLAEVACHRFFVWHNQNLPLEKSAF